MLAREDARALIVELDRREMRNPWLLEDEFESMMEELGQRIVVVDLREVGSLTRMGVATLLTLQGQALVHNSRIVFAGVRPQVLRALSHAGATHVLETYVSIEKALECPPRRRHLRARKTASVAAQRS